MWCLEWSGGRQGKRRETYPVRYDFSRVHVNMLSQILVHWSPNISDGLVGPMLYKVSAQADCHSLGCLAEREEVVITLNRQCSESNEPMGFDQENS